MRPLGSKDKHPRVHKPFCKRGHDISVEGRNTSGRCRACDFNYNWIQRGVLNADGTQFTQIDFDRNYQIQQGKCAICEVHQSTLKQTFDVDHNHSNGYFRGLLCNVCNKAIGSLKDSAELLDKAAIYIRRSL